MLHIIHMLRYSLWKEHLYAMKHQILKRALGLTLFCCIVFQFFIPAAMGAKQPNDEIHENRNIKKNT